MHEYDCKFCGQHNEAEYGEFYICSRCGAKHSGMSFSGDLEIDPEWALHLGEDEINLALEYFKQDDSGVDVQHSLRDDIWETVLQAIAAGHPDPASLARLALRTNETSKSENFYFS